MLIQTPYNINTALIDELLPDIFDKGKTSINQRTGDFFYDPWTVKPEFVGTPWETILDSLPDSIGEARVIVMDSPSCYTQHADIDDRYHLTIVSDKDYLIDLDDHQMYPLKVDGIWYDMDAGKRHTAITVGQTQRVQLVVRHLLTRSNLKDAQTVTIHTTGSQPRYVFDNNLSPWLNKANKKGIIANFKPEKDIVKFDIERSSLSDLLYYLPPEFGVEVKT